MSITRYKTFSDGEILTAADMNGIQDQVIDNDQDVGNPRTESFDMDGQRLILSADGNTSLIASTSNKIDLRLASADLYDFDATVASPVNGLTFIASATGVNTFIQAKGSDTNVGVTVASKGAAGVVLRTNGGAVFVVSGSVASPANGITVTGATTGNRPSIAATGSDTNVGLTIAPKGTGTLLLDADPTGTGVDIDGAPLVLDADGDTSLRETSDDVVALRLQGFDAFIFDGDQMTQTRGLRFRAQNNTNDPSIAAESADTDVNIRLIPKGAGVVASAGGWAVDGATALTWRWTGSSTSLLLQENTGSAASPAWTTRTTVETGGNISGPTLISNQTPTGVPSVTLTLSGGFSRYVGQVTLQPATDGVLLRARTNGGSGVDSGAADYGWQYAENSGAGSLNAVGDISDSEIELCTANVGNAVAEHIDIKIEINPGTGIRRLTWDGGFFDTAGQNRALNGSGARLGGPALTAVELAFSSGNIANGTVRLWGYP
jgi:hypothetical protein